MLIAPFWADIYLRKLRGKLYYRFSTDPSLLSQVGFNVSAGLETDFTPTSLFIATWYRVAGFSGTPDMVSGITLDDADLTGGNQTYVITDDQNNILGLPPTLAAVENVDFDAAGTGICYIWYMRYEDGLTGLEMGSNIMTDLEGLYGLSNGVRVTRN